MASTRYIEFSITTGVGTTTLRIEDRRIINFPMESAIRTGVEYSFVGTAIATGSLFDGRLLWTGAQFLLTPEEYLVLSGLTRKQELQRRSGANFSVTFKNVLHKFVDPNSTRTREIASGTVTTNDDGTIQYFAQHNVAIIQFSVDRNGTYYTASMDWQELDLSA